MREQLEETTVDKADAPARHEVVGEVTDTKLTRSGSGSVSNSSTRTRPSGAQRRPRPLVAASRMPANAVAEPVTATPRQSPGVGAKRVPVSALLAWATAGLLAAAGVIHWAFAPDHIAEYLPFGIAFYIMAVGQLAGGLAVGLRSRSRRLLQGTVLANLGICALWLVTRTVGLPIGATPWTAEKVGVADTVCVMFQIGAALLMAALLVRHRSLEWVRSHRVGFRTAAAALAAFTLVIVPVTVHASKTGHEMADSTMPAKG